MSSGKETAQVWSESQNAMLNLIYTNKDCDFSWMLKKHYIDHIIITVNKQNQMKSNHQDTDSLSLHYILRRQIELR